MTIRPFALLVLLTAANFACNKAPAPAESPSEGKTTTLGRPTSQVASPTEPPLEQSYTNAELGIQVRLGPQWKFWTFEGKKGIEKRLHDEILRVASKERKDEDIDDMRPPLFVVRARKQLGAPQSAEEILKASRGRGPIAEVPPPIEEKTINGVVFATQTRNVSFMKPGTDFVKVWATEYITVRKGHILTFLLRYGTPEERTQFELLMNAIRFDP